MKRLLATAALFVTLVAIRSPCSVAKEPLRATEEALRLAEFLRVQDETWLAANPTRLCVHTVRTSAGKLREEQEFLLWDQKIRYLVRHYPQDGESAGALAWTAFTTYADGEWFHAIDYPRAGSWRGSVSKRPCQYFPTTLWYHWRIPIEQQPLAALLQPSLVVDARREGDDRILVTVGANAQATQYLLGDVPPEVRTVTPPDIVHPMNAGYAGMVITFNRDRGWRPSRIDQVELRSPMRGSASSVPTRDFFGEEGRVVRRTEYSEWIQLEGWWYPTIVTWHWFAELGEVLSPARTMVSTSTLEVIDELPEGADFGHTPPAFFGDVGILSNEITGATDRLDNRPAGVGEEPDVRERILDAMLATGEGGRAPDTPRSGARGFLSYVLMGLGVLALGVALVSMARAYLRRASA